MGSERYRIALFPITVDKSSYHHLSQTEIDGARAVIREWLSHPFPRARVVAAFCSVRILVLRPSFR